MVEGGCTSCGHESLIHAQYCSSCGASLASLESTRDHRMIDFNKNIEEIDRSAFSPAEGLFVVFQGPKAGARYALDTDLITLGRHPGSTIYLDDVSVSRRHAEVYRDGAQYLVRDVGSLNGTYVERQRVDEHVLSEGEELQIGKYKLVFMHGTAAN